MSVPNNGIVRFDGRVGPLWEHYITIASLPFVALKLAAMYDYADFWAPYIALLVCIPLSYVFYRMDRRANQGGIQDEVDQQVPFWSKFSAIVFVVSMAIFIYQDFGYDTELERSKIEIRELENILETVPDNIGGEIV